MTEKFLRGALCHTVHHAERLKGFAERMEMQDAALFVGVRDARFFEIDHKRVPRRQGFEHRGALLCVFGAIGAQFGGKCGVQWQRSLFAVFHRVSAKKHMRLFAFQMQIAPHKRPHLFLALARVEKRQILHATLRRGSEQTADFVRLKRSRITHFFASCIDTRHRFERVKRDALKAMHPIQKRHDCRLVFFERFCGQRLLCAPFNKFVGTDVGEALPSGFAQNYVDAIGRIVGVPFGFSARSDVGNILRDKCRQRRTSGLALRRWTDDALRFLLRFNDDVAEPLARNAKVWRAE